ncbi:MAG: sulfate ABC transporter permease [Halobacteriales archaeon SW_9_67_25]|jgi:molybdate/tungstate transport system permease protein|nr:MAG: sulfate ABC transporter permease [Halobacteriales archaeon SW_9_67_25]
MTRAHRNRRDRTGINWVFGGGYTVFGLLGAVLAVYLLYPFVTFFAGAQGNGIAVADFARPEVVSAARYSLTTAPISTAVATVFGVPLAYFLSRSEFRGKLLVDSLVILPLVLPPVVGGVMLLTGFGSFTPVGQVANSLGLTLTDSYIGIVLAQTFVASPFVVITSRAGFDSVAEYERASRSLGKGPVETFFRVSLPLSSGHILAGIALTFARSIGEFGATMMTAYNPQTMPTQIWVTFISRGVYATLPIVAVLVTLGLAVVVGIRYSGKTIGVRE